MFRKTVVRKGEYQDSVRLMQVSEKLRHYSGVTEAIVMMGTDNNKKIIATAGFLGDQIYLAKADDLIIAVGTDNEVNGKAALAAVAKLLAQRASSQSSSFVHRTLNAAVKSNPDINIAIISVPGNHAAREARQALERGVHVFLFSDNVSISEEVQLKQLAREKHLLVMGPDCGTAIINGVGLGFANAVRRGPIGIVGASGTGIQEISTQLDHLGVGISHAIGTGGRDLTAEVGGITMLMGLNMLAEDDMTNVIVLTSKPPATEVAEKIMTVAKACGKPVVINFLGSPISNNKPPLYFTDSLENTALLAAELVKGTSIQTNKNPDLDKDCLKQLEAWAKRIMPGQNYLRALYAGGTLCYETLLLSQVVLPNIYSNLTIPGVKPLANSSKSIGHTFIDIGEDEFTQGRAHPMIDPSLRNERLLAEAKDPSVALLMVDVVIGFGAPENPAQDLLVILNEIQQITNQQGRYLPIIATVCGAANDFQNYYDQVDRLKQAGVLVPKSNAEAARIALAFMRLIEEERKDL